MKVSLIDYLESLGLTRLDINQLVFSSGELADIDEANAILNIKTLVEFGYPQDDVGDFVLINPGFMLYSNDTLKKILSSLDDVEETLKNDPFAI